MSLHLFTPWVQGEALVGFFQAMVPMTDNSKRTGAAIEAHYRFLAWLVPTIEKFPKSHKFTIGDRIETIALDVLEALIEATYTRVSEVRIISTSTAGLRMRSVGLKSIGSIQWVSWNRCTRLQICLLNPLGALARVPAQAHPIPRVLMVVALIRGPSRERLARLVRGLVSRHDLVRDQIDVVP